MAHGKTMELAKIRPGIIRYWTPEEWAKRHAPRRGRAVWWPRERRENNPFADHIKRLRRARGIIVELIATL